MVFLISFTYFCLLVYTNQPPPTTKKYWFNTFFKNRPPKKTKQKHKVVLGTFLLPLFVDVWNLKKMHLQKKANACLPYRYKYCKGQVGIYLLGQNCHFLSTAKIWLNWFYDFMSLVMEETIIRHFLLMKPSSSRSFI